MTRSFAINFVTPHVLRRPRKKAGCRVKHGMTIMTIFLLGLALLFPLPAFAQFNAFKDPVPGSSSGATSGPDLKAVLEKIDAGRASMGATAYVVAMFKNNGTSPVNVTGINLYPSSTVGAQVNSNKCADAPLPPDAQCAVTVAITALGVGAFRVEILLDHDGRTRLATAALSGTVEASFTQAEEQVRPDIEAVPSELDFGSATGGIPLARSVLLRNRTSEKVNLTDFRLDAPDQAGFSFKPECPKDLSPGQSCTIGVTWTPGPTGAAQGALTVVHSAKSGITKIDIKGTFAPAAVASAPLYPAAASDMGILVSDKDKVDFGTGVKSVSAITVSLVNAGAADLTLKTIGLAGSDNGLSIARAGCRAGTVLKPVDACALTINWVPSREGTVIDDLQVLHTGARGVLILPIRGAADAAASRESIALRQSSSDIQGERGQREKTSTSTQEKTDLDFIGEFAQDAPSAMTPVLDGYVVTSLSPTKAIINGPVGSLVVRDGEDVVISGGRWTVTIISTGVILSGENDEIMLVFDKSLRPSKKTSTVRAAETATTPAPATPASETTSRTTTLQR